MCVILHVLNKTSQNVVLNEELVFYRKHTDSISTTISIKNMHDFCNACDVFENFIQNYPDIFTKKDLYKIHQRKLFILISGYAKNLHKIFPDKNGTQNWLIAKIKECNSDNEVGNCCFELRVIYFLLFHAPIVFSCGAALYRIVRKFILKQLSKLTLIFD